MELAQAYVQIIPSADGISNGITSALVPEASSAGDEAGEKSGSNFASKLKAVIAAAGIGLAIKGAFDAVGDLASLGDTIDKQSQKIGISAKAYQEWDAVLQHSGTSINTMQAAMKKMTSAAASGSDAFQKLGISQEEAMSMSQEDLFARVIEGLQGMEAGTERAALAQDLLGRGSQEMAALLNTSAEDTQKMKDAVNELGGVMSDEAVKAAAAYQDSLQDMTTSMDGLKRGLLSGFLPAFTTVMDGLTAIFSGNSDKGLGLLKTGISDAIQNLHEAVPRMMEIGRTIFSALYQAVMENLPQIVSGGTELIVNLVSGIVEAIPSLIEAAFTILTTLVEALLEQAPVLAEAGLNMLTSLTEGMDPLVMIEKIGEILGSLVDHIIEWIPALLDQGIAMVDEMSAGLAENGPAAIEAIGSILGDLITKIIDNLPEFLAKGIELIAHIAQGILDNLPEILSAMAGVLADLIAKIAESLPDFLAKGVELLGEVGAGILDAVPDLLGKIPGIFSDVVGKFASQDWASIGKNIIEGVKSGVTSAAHKIADAAKEAARKALDAAKSFLGIKSPSRVFKEQIGKNISLGLAGGISGYSTGVARAAENLAESAFDAARDFLGIKSPSKKFQWIADMAVEGLVRSTRAGLGKVERAGADAARAYLGAWDGISLRTAAGVNLDGRGGKDTELLTAVNALGDRIGQMRLVTDTGALVGELAEDMNDRLGYIAKMEALA